MVRVAQEDGRWVGMIRDSLEISGCRQSLRNGWCGQSGSGEFVVRGSLEMGECRQNLRK